MELSSTTTEITNTSKRKPWTDEDLESFSLNVETGDIEKTYITGKKEKKRQYIFVSEDGKTAECIDDLGKKIF